MNEWGAFLAVAAAWGWIGAVLMFIFTGFPARGVFRARQAAFWGGGVVLCFACWIVGMLLA